MSATTDLPAGPPGEPPAPDVGGDGDHGGDHGGEGGGTPGGGGARGGTAGAAALAWLRGLANSLIIPVLALVTALLVGGLVIIFTTPDVLDEWASFFSDPGGTLRASWDIVYESYRALWESSLGSPRVIGRTLTEATPLALGGLSVALAFRAGMFNIGAAGQIVIGATCAGWVGFTWDLPPAIHLPLAVAAGFAGGAAWGGIAGVLKARTGAHEVITTIMLNYISYRVLDWALRSDAFQPAGRDDPISKAVRESGRLPEITIGNVEVHAGLFVAIAAAAAVWWLLDRSTVGFRMRSVGANPFAARYAGMSVGAMYVLAMVLAGGLAGLAGTANILGRPSFSLTGGYYAFLGFDSIAVALLGRAQPAGVLAAAFLFGVLRSGSTGMQANTTTPVDIIVVIQALIILFVAAPALVRSIYRIKAGRGTGQTFTTSWGA
ncbi:MAG TPA: ABC transporter permease [Acidimicrobiales bacterium]|nr:ABC transporter permease [Acidimicrobiales bacterium]